MHPILLIRPENEENEGSDIPIGVHSERDVFRAASVMLVALMVALGLAAAIRRRYRHWGDSATLILSGVVLGFLAKAMGYSDLNTILSFSQDFFLAVLLPPIILTAGFRYGFLDVSPPLLF